MPERRFIRRTVMAKNCHESEKLNKRLGRKVKLTFWDGKIKEGILERDEYSDRYKVDNLTFYKTHVTKIE